AGDPGETVAMIEKNPVEPMAVQKFTQPVHFRFDLVVQNVSSLSVVRQMLPQPSQRTPMALFTAKTRRARRIAAEIFVLCFDDFHLCAASRSA
ncbi:MAG: hypothetical protein ABSC42_10435, partial [Tepidisphaeraceae bacterium]